MTTSRADYEQGSQSKIAVVLSCPGKKEQEKGNPAAGQTGKNLEYVLSTLKNTYKLTDFERGRITIANSWGQVEFKGDGGTGRTEADILEVIEKDNLDRLSEDIKETTDYIICCGVNSKVTVSVLQYAGKLIENCRVIYVCHLGNQAINMTITQSVDGNEIKPCKKLFFKTTWDERTLKNISADNRYKRLAVVAKSIYDQIQA